MNTIEVSRVDAAINYAVEKLSESDAVIAQIKAEYMQITVESPQDQAGFETASTALKRMSRLRIDVEKTRKELKKDSVRYGKTVDGEAKRIQSEIEPIETHLKTQADVVRLEQKRLEIVEENRRREEIREWISRLNEIGAPVNPDALNVMSREDFKWHFLTAKSEADKRTEERAEFKKQQAELQAERDELAAHDATWSYLRTQAGNPLIVLPTGAGKPLVTAMLIEQAAERLKLREAETVRRLVSDRDARRAASKGSKSEIEADRLADEQVTDDEFGAAKSEGPTVQNELDGFAAQVAWLDIPDSLSEYTLRIRKALRTASNHIKDLA